MKAVYVDSWTTCHCDKCCAKCPDLTKCKYACPKLAEQVKQLKANAKEQRKQEKLAQEEADRPIIRKIQALWQRFGEARNVADVSVKDTYKALGRWYSSSDDEKVVKCECLEEKFTTQTQLPYSYDCRLGDVEKYVRLADLFNCSIDYLFCRVDTPGGFSKSGKTAVPTADVQIVPAMWYPNAVEPPIGEPIVIVAEDGWAEGAEYIGCGTLLDESVTRWKDVRAWSLQPQAVAAAPTEDTKVAERVRWFPGSEAPEEPIDAVAIFSVDGKSDPIRVIAHWNGGEWRFSKTGVSIEAICVRWFPLPPDE